MRGYPTKALNCRYKRYAEMDPVASNNFQKNSALTIKSNPALQRGLGRAGLIIA